MAAALSSLDVLTRGLQLDPLPEIPQSKTTNHAPARPVKLTKQQFKLAIRNALRYFPQEFHSTLAPEFAEELRTLGHIYMYRFMPTEYEMRAHPIEAYPARCLQAAAIMLMIQNNLDPAVAQYPEELITYGGNGSVFQNWAQYHLTMQYLSCMTEQQTLSMYSGHPMGLFPSHTDAPRVVLTNGMVVPNYSSKEQYETMFATGVSMYGQMTAGSYCYIGPQGIVHGTVITLLNAGRKYLGSNDLSGKVFLTSGLGGMSGAQAKAAVICGAVGVVAEVDAAALDKRHSQGWVQERISDLEQLVERIRRARAEKQPVSIGFHGNVVQVWERLAQEDELLVELGSDQTSLHNPYHGGYYPVTLDFSEARAMMVEDPAQFKRHVQASLRRHVAAVNTMAAKGMRFWDYGNSFLLEASRAGAEVHLVDTAAEAADSKAGADNSCEVGATAAAEAGDESEARGASGADDSNGARKPGEGGVGGGEGGSQQQLCTVFRYPSYVQDIMGDIFSLGFGPFRWVCTSGSAEDLAVTDRIALRVMQQMRDSAPPVVESQLNDNILWIANAASNNLVVGSQARILYADLLGRASIALEFNKAIADGSLSAPVVLSRDHHDVSGTDSPFRETSNITDGSAFTADMAVQNCIGDAIRGATWVAIHNGGGVGWGEVMNGGFGLLLDGTADAARRAHLMLSWDVSNGVARRAWGGNPNARFAIQRAMEATAAAAAAGGDGSAPPPQLLQVTLASPSDEGLLEQVTAAALLTLGGSATAAALPTEGPM